VNLIGDRWVPVVWENGKSDFVSLEQLYREAENIRDLCVNPPQRIALMRLFLCITQAALNGPANEEDWKSCRSRIIPESLDYLKHRVDKFDLYGKWPFLQVAELKHTWNAVVDKLDFGLAAGNNATLFDHAASDAGRGQEAAWRALMLLTYQCFSPGGKIGRTEWSGHMSLPTKGTSEHAPCLENSPIHTLIRGKSILETIQLNLLTKTQIAHLPNSAWGVPHWDHFPASQTDDAVAELTHSYLGRLVPLSRGILTERDNERMTLVNGLAYPKLPEGREPMLSVVVRGKGEKEHLGYINLNLTRHVWRELGSILSLKYATLAGGPLALQNLIHADSVTVADIWTGGLVADKGKILDTAEWSFSIPVSMLGEGPIEKYGAGVSLANQGEFAVRNATKEYAAIMKVESVGHVRRGTVQYWGILDSHYQDLVGIASDDTQNFSDWRKTITVAMSSAYDKACPHETARQIQAFAQARRLLEIREKTGDSA